MERREEHVTGIHDALNRRTVSRQLEVREVRAFFHVG
jgi:hypothetical protein